MDKIIIRDLRLSAVIGVNPEEQLTQQDLLATIELEVDLTKAAASDALEDTVDYKELKGKLLAVVSHSKLNLLEALAGRLADVCLEDSRIAAVKIILDKPGALRYARSAAVELRKTRK